MNCWTPRSIVPLLAVLAGSAGLGSCTENNPTQPVSVDDALLARGGGGGGPKVQATDPPGAPQNIRLNVRIIGSGFADGATAEFVLDGVAVPEVITHSTTFVSDTELIADVEVDATATIALYDVAVENPPPRGKKGTGADLFSVVAEGTTAEPIDLGFGNGDYSQALDANRYGQVVGRTFFLDGPHAGFLWTESGGVVAIPTLGGSDSDATAINDAGQVAGSADVSIGVTHAIRWTESGGLVDLGTLGGTSSWAGAINENGWVAGSSQTGPQGVSHCFLWTPGGGMQDIGSLAPGTGTESCWAEDVNIHGHVVGSSTNANGDTRAFLWTPAGGMQDLGTLGSEWSQAFGINDQGQVAGDSRKAGSTDNLAFLWSEGTGMLELGTLGGPTSHAEGVNNRSAVAGISRIITGKRKSAARAFVWTETDGMIPLGTLQGGSWSQAWGLSEANGDIVWVVGNADFGDSSHAVAWRVDLTALPEPPPTDDGGGPGNGGGPKPR